MRRSISAAQTVSHSLPVSCNGLGLPVGLSFFGRPFSEGKLIGYAYAFAFEQATKHRKPPRYLPTVELT